MKTHTTIRTWWCVVASLLLGALTMQAQKISDNNVVWNTPGKHSGESMPCGGGDIGMNVWVEDGDILFYFSRSGTFDEHNTLLKQGRVRVRLSPNPFAGDSFRQELQLESGSVKIWGQDKKLSSTITLRADVFRPVIQMDVQNSTPLQIEVFYENWRYQDRVLRKTESNQNSYKWAAPEGMVTKKDAIAFDGNAVCFYHRNEGETVFDVAVAQQGMQAVVSQMFDPLRNLTSGGKLTARGLKAVGIESGEYAGTDYQAWKLASAKPLKSTEIKIFLHTNQSETITGWQHELQTFIAQTEQVYRNGKHRKANQEWWQAFWNRSFIHISTHTPADSAYAVGRNYQLFRYMLACNAYGEYPTKFNGGLFTYDPCYMDTTTCFTPDFRKWGGGTHTAQNQRLVYFPMLKSGDFDMMKSQFNYYMQALPNAELRSQVYWGHNGACFTEQLENFGLPNPSEYGWKRPDFFDKGMEYNAWLEYQWDTALEFCLMMMETERYAGHDITDYLPMIKSCLRFFDEHYQYLARQRGRRVLNEENKLVLYPGSACETYKMAYNANSTIAALQVVTNRLLELPEVMLDSVDRTYFAGLAERIPDITFREINGKKVIAPALLWERINNTETPQLYPVFPWGIFGVGLPDLDVAINTWEQDPDVHKFRSHVGWKQDAIWAARLGLAEEAWQLTHAKLKNSPRRFPTFWGPGYDWTPDHNWGGSGMIALQDMLLQSVDDKILLFPAWLKERDVHFKLHAPYNTIIECELVNGEIKQLKVWPEHRKKDVVLMLN